MSEVLKVENINFSYGKRQVLNDVSFNIKSGEYISVIGPNGSGKSTLFYVLSGFFKNYSGQIFLFGENLKSITISQRAKSMTIIHQSEDCNFPYTCMELILMGAYPSMGRSWKIKSETLQEVKEIMEMTDTLKFADKKISEVSGGELQRVLLGRALLQKPKLLLLDEAMSDMDINYKISSTKLLKDIIRKENISVICINHDLNMAYNFSDRIIALKDGIVAADGLPRDVFTKKFFKDVFAVEAEIMENKGFLIKDNIN